MKLEVFISGDRELIGRKRKDSGEARGNEEMEKRGEGIEKGSRERIEIRRNEKQTKGK